MRSTLTARRTMSDIVPAGRGVTFAAPGPSGPGREGSGGDQRTPRIPRETGRAMSSMMTPMPIVTAPSTPK
ncbi:hypothetical protein GCM10028787_14750 [Brachybacterium horti]